MNRSSTKLILCISVFSTFIFLASLAFKWNVVTGLSLYTAFFGMFYVLINHDISRITKGFLMIMLGIFWGIFVPKVVDGLIPDGFAVHWLLFTNIATYACSGAGGSLIAAHAELGYKKSESTIVTETVIDKTKHIESLIASVDKLKRTTLIIHGFYGLVLLISILVFVF